MNTKMHNKSKMLACDDQAYSATQDTIHNHDVQEATHRTRTGKDEKQQRVDNGGAR